MAEPASYPSTMARLAIAFGMDAKSLDQAWKNTPVEPPAKRLNREAPTLSIVDTGVIPEWEIDLRASQWAPVPVATLDYDDEDQRRIINAGRFRLRILGKCMEPAYQDGAMVEFQIVRHDEPLPLFHDYAVCRSDGTATFKRLQQVTEDEFVLAALNQREHPGVLRVPRQEVSRLAVAVRVLMDVPTPEPVKVRKGKG